MGDFKRLAAWREGNDLAREVHAAFSVRDAREYPGLRAQVLRAAASIPANLAEGCAKRSRRDLARFAEMAYASAKEVECHLILARDVRILPTEQFSALAKRTDLVAKLCYGLTRIRPSAPG
ncbi:MAG: four helix bundle protein [bacterium]